jgi:N-methylhydantoinase B/oxoprolinase/acetone carboxylase alpha subunit
MIEAQIAGGAGFGDPRERALEAIAADLEDGYITEEGALRDYGRLPTRIPATQTGND